VQRVAILGAGGAGKSELARALAERTGLPVVHLDAVYWRPGWTAPPPEEFRATLDAAVARERWILDGNFLRDDSEDPRFVRADTVVFLDYPRSTCLRRALGRWLRDRRRQRADLPQGCPEGFDLPFLRWVWNYPRKNRPDVLARLEKLGPAVAVHRLRSDADVRWFLAGV
jgi:adenylate kinase family enzyme